MELPVHHRRRAPAVLSFSSRLAIVEEVAFSALCGAFDRDAITQRNGLERTGYNLLGLVGTELADLAELGHVQALKRASPERRGDLDT